MHMLDVGNCYLHICSLVVTVNCPGITLLLYCLMSRVAVYEKLAVASDTTLPSIFNNFLALSTQSLITHRKYKLRRNNAIKCVHNVPSARPKGSPNTSLETKSKAHIILHNFLQHKKIPPD